MAVSHKSRWGHLAIWMHIPGPVKPSIQQFRLDHIWIKLANFLSLLSTSIKVFFFFYVCQSLPFREKALIWFDVGCGRKYWKCHINIQNIDNSFGIIDFLEPLTLLFNRHVKLYKTKASTLSNIDIFHFMFRFHWAWLKCCKYDKPECRVG